MHEDEFPVLRERRIVAPRAIVGKTIKRVLLRVRKEDCPRCQFLMEFDDKTTFEFFSSEIITPAKSLSCDNSIMEPSDGTDIIDRGTHRGNAGRNET
jgi:hypothetical protein